MATSREVEREGRRAHVNGDDATPAPVRDADDNLEPSFFDDPRRLALTGAFVLVAFAAIYFLLPNVIGLEDAFAKMNQGSWSWFAVAIGFNVAAFGAYVALFRGVIGGNVILDWSASYQITMAGLAASRLLSAGGAGGVVLSYWACARRG